MGYWFSIHSQSKQVLARAIDAVWYLILCSIAYPWIQGHASLLSLFILVFLLKLIVLLLTFAFTKKWQSIHTIANRVAKISGLVFFPCIYIDGALLPLAYLLCVFACLALLEEATLVITRPYDQNRKGLFLFTD